jgi:hypothetical protein
MIKYEIESGSKHIKVKAMGMRAIYKERLKGMSCRKCPGIDSVIHFRQSQDYPGSGSVNTTIIACCQDFDDQIRSRLS